jgi:Acetyltransferase (GNAT) domain
MFTGTLTAGSDFFPEAARRSGGHVAGTQWNNPLELKDWDAQINDHAERTFFHGADWANVLAETYGYQPFYLVEREAGLRSILPLMEVRSALTGKRAGSLPFTDHCEPLCPDKTSFLELFRNAIEMGKLRGWKYLEIRGGHKFLNGMQPSHTFYGHTLNVPRDENRFVGELKSPVRRAIRKGEKAGVRVEISGDFNALRDFYRLHCITRRRHGSPPQPFSFFKNIYKHVLRKGAGIVILARWKKNPIAGAVFFNEGGSAFYKFGASDEAFQHLRGNNLVFREAIRWFSRRGAKKIDLGRTSLANEGLRRFKLGWEAEERTIHYFRYCLKNGKFISATDESYGWHNFLLRKTPIFASRIIGQILYRHWA